MKQSPQDFDGVYFPEFDLSDFDILKYPLGFYEVANSFLNCSSISSALLFSTIHSFKPLVFKH